MPTHSFAPLPLRCAQGSVADHLCARAAGQPPSGLAAGRTRVEVALQAAQGLLFLHSMRPNRLLHRDVKPENILLDAELRAFVTDYGDDI